MRNVLIAFAAAASLVLLAGCGERVQTATGPAKKADGKAWDGAQNPFVVPGWKPGDQASWEGQMRARAMGQNEYNRAPAKAN